VRYLECREVSKRFGALEALRGFSFEVERGEILGLIGPNGSGKTTLFNVIVGIQAPEEGEILFQGRSLSGLPPHKICRLGIAKASQMTQSFLEYTALENLLIPAMFGKDLSLKKGRIQAESILNFINLPDLRDIPMGEISLAKRRQLEIGRVLATGAEILLLDEVMAGLNPHEVEEALQLLQKIREEGKTMILVEHVMQAVMSFSERIIVLNHGEKVAEGKPEEVAQNPEVIQAYLGRPYA
jgi:branched-chain amino acid transport system ATP-binding protein